ncbi:rna-directed dna polymerase from mobile element jockey-like protein [Lasius niger]|uniref:Rna-directed dna polymerase from mobile element jockey-like protein n=1 Tax=Lasius niger TaxID=67767 RepID=A0A0J7K7P8_LASNI|nr:rna-directed dna polymerase from mobile element jockey-like protein [Lasius niger]
MLGLCFSFVYVINPIDVDIVGAANTVNNVITCVKENEGAMENFECVNIKKLEKIVMGLSSKKELMKGYLVILKAAFPVIREELLGLINISLSKGQCPDGWKTSTIVPIPKLTNLKKASEYRPINILPTYEKILELVVKDQLEAYFDSNDVITVHQFGFRKHHSCETAIQVIIDKWKLIISRGKMVGVIFMNLKRAFETVDRGRLLKKLHDYGIRENVLAWLRSYLCNRKQQVKFNNKWSKLVNAVTTLIVIETHL